MRTLRLPRPWALAALVLVGGCRTPAADAAIAEQLAQMSDALVSMRDQMAMLNTTVDSLVVVVAKQDTVIKKLSAAVPVQ